MKIKVITLIAIGLVLEKKIGIVKGCQDGVMGQFAEFSGDKKARSDWY